MLIGLVGGLRSSRRDPTCLATIPFLLRDGRSSGRPAKQSMPAMRAGSPCRPASAGLANLVGVVAVLVLSACGSTAFVPYEPTADLVPPLADSSSVHLGSPYEPELASGCDARELRLLDEPGPDGSEWRAVSQKLYTPDERSRIVWFATRRFDNRGDYDEQWTQIGDWFREPCVDANDPSVIDIEPHPLDGQPDGAITAHWPTASQDWWSTVIGDRDQHLMMIMVWNESPGSVPTETFVDVANVAWNEFRANND